MYKFYTSTLIKGLGLSNHFTFRQLFVKNKEKLDFRLFKICALHPILSLQWV